MLIDTGADVTILKLSSLHDDVWIRDIIDDKLILTGIGSNMTTLGCADCHLKIGNKELVHTVHIVSQTFQLEEDGLIGADLLEKVGAKIDYESMTAELIGEKIKLFKIDSENTSCLIDTSHMDKLESDSIVDLYSEFKDIFKHPNQYLTSKDTIRHEIPVDPNQPSINQKPYRLPESQKPIIEEQIKELKSSDIIRESTSPWNSPIVLVPKKSPHGSPKYRMCVDLRRLNDVTKGDALGPPNITDILERSIRRNDIFHYT